MYVNIEIVFLDFLKNEFLNLRGLWFVDGSKVFQIWLRQFRKDNEIFGQFKTLLGPGFLRPNNKNLLYIYGFYLIRIQNKAKSHIS